MKKSDESPRRPRYYLARREQLRLLLMVFSLGLVVLLGFFALAPYFGT